MSENDNPSKAIVSEDGLNARQILFCEEYLKDLNATRAAERAGYTGDDSTLAVTAARLMRISAVKSRVMAGMKERSEAIHVDTYYVLENLREIVERSMQRAPVMIKQGRHMVQMKDEAGRDVWKFDATGANSALHLLGKHLKMFTEKHEHSGPNGKPIELNHSDMSDEQIDAKIKALLMTSGSEEKQDG